VSEDVEVWVEAAVWNRLHAIRPRIPDLQLRIEAAADLGGQEAVDELLAALLEGE
jgi:hypothetical protein